MICSVKMSYSDLASGNERADHAANSARKNERLDENVFKKGILDKINTK